MDDSPTVPPLSSGPRIDSVFIYCNRWCERCRFTTRCTLYADRLRLNAGLPLDREDDPEPSEDTREFIRELEEAGAFREPTYEEMKDATRVYEAAERRVKRHPLTRLVGAYLLAADFALGEIGGSDTDEHLEVIRWHQYLIGAKIQRALMGRAENLQDASDLQSDANGSAKVALIAMDDSMNAWLRVSARGAALDAIREAVELLEKTRAMLEREFRDARRFIRPGFDTQV